MLKISWFYVYCSSLFFPPLNYYNFKWQGTGWKIVACFEGRFPDRMKQLPLDRHFDINNVKRVSFDPTDLWIALYTGLLDFLWFCYTWWPFCLLTDCVRSRWLSAISHFTWKGIKITNQRSSRACKRAITPLCWWGIFVLCIEWVRIIFNFLHSGFNCF